MLTCVCIYESVYTLPLKKTTVNTETEHVRNLLYASLVALDRSAGEAWFLVIEVISRCRCTPFSLSVSRTYKEELFGFP